jgi:phage gp29-like protein
VTHDLPLPGGGRIEFAAPRSASGALVTRDTALNGVLAHGWLPNPDPILKAMGADLAAYRDLRADAAVAGALRRRRAALLSMEWGIDRDRSRSRFARLCTEALNALDTARLFAEIAEASELGYAVLEIRWSRRSGHWLPAAIEGKPQEWFAFSARDNRLLFRSRSHPDGEPLPERACLLAVQDPRYDNPYGNPDLAPCFWPVAFRRGGLRFWTRFTEKYGTPYLVGKLPRSAPQEEYDALANRLADMVQDAIAVLPDDGAITALTLDGSAHSDNFERYLRYCRSEITIALLGQDQTTESDSTRASAQAGADVAAEIRDGQARLVTATITTLIDWIAQANGYSGPRPTFEMWEQEEVDATLAQRDVYLTQAGARLTADYFRRAYGLEQGDLDETPPPEPPGAAADPADPADPADAPAFADPDREPDPVALLADQLDRSSAPAIDGWLDTVRALLADAPSLEEFRERLAAAWPDLDRQPYTLALAEALAATHLRGMAEIADPEEDENAR